MTDVKTVQVTFDCADPDRLARFWAEALGYQVDPPPPGFESWPDFLGARGVPEVLWNARSACSDPTGVGPRLFFQRVPEPKTVKNRLHLDVRIAPGLTDEARTAALEAECERLRGLGATRRDPWPADGPGFEAFDQDIIIMLDPEGNEFCLD
ncbi:VOC family protein [Propionibacteriaceae bacterium G57]|uniref:VOC family protein n=1 Tax=Aestuariimicrobium sp. G57 TaxID=3418485 RepID=UPI003DA6E16C